MQMEDLSNFSLCCDTRSQPNHTMEGEIIQNESEKEEENKQDQEQGVLLYYKYVEIPHQDSHSLVHWFRNHCSSLGLVGRVRIARDGINVTVGGKMTSLQKHIVAVDSNALFKGCDFKLASCQGPLDQQIAKECGFTSLSVRAVKDVVSLASHPLVRSPLISNAGKHLSAAEFHSVLQMAGGKLQVDSNAFQLKCEIGDGQNDRGLVVLDARNLYETRIGKFQPPEQVQILDPNIRQYSDLPDWIDRHAEELRGNCILMYCTGGVRCEMASAYIKMKGLGYENVYQLSGGIQRYLEAYPDGGFFKGKNFVFDPRISVGSTDTGVVGSCLLCADPYDDYSSRCRCSHCRMLVLVCIKCQDMGTSNKESPTYICELCQKNGRTVDSPIFLGESNATFLNDRLRADKDAFAAKREHDFIECLDGSDQNVEPSRLDASPLGMMDLPVIQVLPRRKLKILCLHGFRQNASSLKGRLASFGKKLKHLAEFVFVDAPHEVPFIYQPFCNQGKDGKDNIVKPRDSIGSFNHSQLKPSLPDSCKKKHAWLIAPSSYYSNFTCRPTNMALNLEMDPTKIACMQDSLPQGTSKSEKWIEATSPFDPFQYQQQTEGWSETLTHLRKVFSDMGPFDGVLGFSQGASVVAILCTLRHKHSVNDGDIYFRFAILCSGFPSPAGEFQQFISNPSFLPIDCPSLHIFGGNAQLDKQIMGDTSMQLASFFRSDCRVVVKHSLGHIIPAQPPYIDRIKEFLLQFT